MQKPDDNETFHHAVLSNPFQNKYTIVFIFLFDLGWLSGNNSRLNM